MADTFGNVYVADSDNFRIQKFISDGTSSPRGALEAQEMGNLAVALAASPCDSAGNVYVADYDLERIQK